MNPIVVAVMLSGAVFVLGGGIYSAGTGLDKAGNGALKASVAAGALYLLYVKVKK